MPKKSSWIPYGSAVVVAALVVLFAWFTRGQLSPVGAGRPAPDFSAYDMVGTPRSLDDYQDKVLLVNIWATWCPPCREEMPSMQRLYQEIDDDRFEIVAISIDAPLGETDPFGRVGGDLVAYGDSLGITFSLLHDPSGRVQRTFQTTGVPESFVIDQNGVIFKKISGSTQWDAPQNVDLVRRLLGR